MATPETRKTPTMLEKVWRWRQKAADADAGRTPEQRAERERELLRAYEQMLAARKTARRAG